jgi:hypothetical protein
MSEECDHVPAEPGAASGKWTFCWRCQCLMKKVDGKWVYDGPKQIDSSTADKILADRMKNE